MLFNFCVLTDVSSPPLPLSHQLRQACQAQALHIHIPLLKATHLIYRIHVVPIHHSASQDDKVLVHIDVALAEGPAYLPAVFQETVLACHTLTSIMDWN